MPTDFYLDARRASRSAAKSRLRGDLGGARISVRERVDEERAPQVVIETSVIEQGLDIEQVA